MNFSISQKSIIAEDLVKHGDLKQKVVLFENMSKLIQAVCKELRGIGSIENITNGLSDVMISLQQLQMMYNIKDEDIHDIVSRKLKDVLEEL